MIIRTRILGLVVGGACASIVAGCSAEQGETALDTAETIEIAPGQDEARPANAQEPNATEAPANEAGDLAPQTLAPACIERAMLAQRSLYLHSNCGSRQWVKVIIRTGADSDCFPIDPNQTKTVNWAWPGTFDRLDSC